MISSKTILWRLETRKTAVIPDIGQEASHSKISDLTLHLTYTLYLKVDIASAYPITKTKTFKFKEPQVL